MPTFSESMGRVKDFIKRQYKILIVIFFLLVLYFAYNPIYTRYFLHVGKPTFIGNLQGTEQSLSFYIDKYQETRFDGQDTYQIVGWAYPKGIDHPMSEYSTQIVLINDHSTGYFFAPLGMTRVDVTKAFSDLGVNLDQSGFLVNISKYALPKGSYTIGFLFSPSDGSASILCRSTAHIVKTANKLQLIQGK